MNKTHFYINGKESKNPNYFLKAHFYSYNISFYMRNDCVDLT